MKLNDRVFAAGLAVVVAVLVCALSRTMIRIWGVSGGEDDIIGDVQACVAVALFIGVGVPLTMLGRDLRAMLPHPPRPPRMVRDEQLRAKAAAREAAFAEAVAREVAAREAERLRAAERANRRGKRTMRDMDSVLLSAAFAFVCFIILMMLMNSTWWPNDNPIYLLLNVGMVCLGVLSVVIGVLSVLNGISEFRAVLWLRRYPVRDRE